MYCGALNQLAPRAILQRSNNEKYQRADRPWAELLQMESSQDRTYLAGVALPPEPQGTVGTHCRSGSETGRDLGYGQVTCYDSRVAGGRRIRARPLGSVA